MADKHSSIDEIELGQRNKIATQMSQSSLTPKINSTLATSSTENQTPKADDGAVTVPPTPKKQEISPQKLPLLRNQNQKGLLEAEVIQNQNQRKVKAKVEVEAEVEVKQEEKVVIPKKRNDELMILLGLTFF